MFDKFYPTFVTRSEAPRYPQTVHEHRAPTDESIKLYKEMLEKARAEVVSVVLNDLPQNVLSHATIRMEASYMTGDISAMVAFRLNGVDHKIKLDLDDLETFRKSVARVFVEELTKNLGANLFKELQCVSRG